jgi:hypothetical protein
MKLHSLAGEKYDLAYVAFNLGGAGQPAGALPKLAIVSAYTRNSEIVPQRGVSAHIHMFVCQSVSQHVSKFSLDDSCGSTSTGEHFALLCQKHAEMPGGCHS